MKYITGIIALGTECRLESKGIWNVRKKDFLNEDNMKLIESDDTPFKDWGIEKDKIINYHEFALYNVANHVRAYIDMLYFGKFEEAKGLFAEAIDNAKCRSDIFMLIYGKTRHLAEFTEIDEFMTEEFGNAWIAYKDAVHSSAEHLSKATEQWDNVFKVDAFKKAAIRSGTTVQDFK